MPKSAGLFTIQKRKDTKRFILTLNPSSGLSLQLCQEWTRRSFQLLPDSLAEYRNPKSKAAAKNGAFALIQYLKSQAEQPAFRIGSGDITVGEWLQRFISLDNNPRSARLISKNRPYSPKTIVNYANYFQNHIAEDHLVTEKMAVVEQADILAFMGRLAGHKLKGGGTMSGTRSFEIVYKFIRMAFREYQRHPPAD